MCRSKNFNVKIPEDDLKIIDENLKLLSHMLGYRINKSALIRHFLLNLKTKQDLFNIGFISFAELCSNSPTRLFKKYNVSYIADREFKRRLK